MLSDDQNPSDYPYQLLIRARTQAQFEQAIISITSRMIAATLTSGYVEKLLPIALKAVNSVTLRETASNRAPVASNVMSALQTMADYDDCGTGWPKPRCPWPWPWPWPWSWQEGKPSPDPWVTSGVFDAAALKTINKLALLAPKVCQEIADVSAKCLKEMAR